MIRRLINLRDRLAHREIHVTDADVGAAGDTVWVTGYRGIWPCCVSLLMSREEAATLAEMLRDVSDEEPSHG